MKTHPAWIRWFAALGLVLAAGPPDAHAATGTLHTSTLTFADSTSASLPFNVRTDIPADADGTSVQLEFAPDGNNAALGAETFSTPAAVTFSLSYNGTAISGFSCTAAQAVAPSPGSCMANPSSPNVSILLSKQPSFFGRYSLTISYPEGSSGLTATWVLGISGISTSPSIRGNAAIINGAFQPPLVPAGAGTAATCPAGQTCKGPCPSVCPLGQKCKGDIFNICVQHPEICVAREIIWIPKYWNWPPPGPNPCLSCPEPWKEKIGDDFERVLVTFSAVQQGGEIFSTSEAQPIQLSVTGGRTIGDLVDLGDGQYAQMIESRKGEASPRVGATIGGVAQPEFVAGSFVGRRSGGGALTVTLGILLVAALAALAYMSRRNSANAGR